MKSSGLKKVLISAVATVLGISVLAGCGSDKSTATSPKYKQEMLIAINAAPETYDLGKTTATVAKQMVGGNVFETLVALDESFTPQPELAEKIDVNKDFTEYVYHLRKGVLFHNKKEMKADDVVASMNRWIKTNGSAKMATGGALFEKVDDYTVKITMEKPLMSLNDLIGGLRPMPIIVPAEVIANADEKTGMIKDYIGTGPYMVDKIVPDNSITLKKFDEYKPYGEKGKASGWIGYKEAKTPTVVFKFVPDSSSRVAGIQSGEYDLAIQMPVDNYGQFKGNKDFTIFKELQGETGLTYNKKTGIAANKYFRQAVNAALNSHDIMKAAYVEDDFYKLTASYIPDDKNFWYSEKGKEFYNQANAAKTKELLAKANYNGEPFKLVVSSHYQEFYNAAIVVERNLKEAGINVQLDVVDWSTYLTKAKDPNAYDAFITGFATWVVPNTILYLSPSWNGWSTDEKLQTGMDSILHETDKNKAKTKWEEIMEYNWSDYVPESKFGNRYIYDVASAKVKDMIFFEGPRAYNVVVEEQ